MTKRNKGFTLIEVMVVFAIVGIIAAAAIPMFQRYVIKSQLNRAISELGVYRSAFEANIASAVPVNNSSLGYMPSKLTTGDAATEIATVNADGSGHLQVTLGGDAHLNLAGTVIRFERTAGGEWFCTLDASANSAWKHDYNPDNCGIP